MLLTLEASQAAFLGQDAVVDTFTRTLFRLPAARAARWREAVSLALLGDWYDTLVETGNGTFGASDLLGYLRRETRRVHLQLQPLWERKVGGHQVRLLDQPVGQGMLLRDLVTDGSGPDKTVLRTVLDDQRLAAVLALMSPAEQAVARAWAYDGASTWQEAAQGVGASAPAAFGERVRRKLRRQGREYLRRRPAATATGLWLAPQATSTPQAPA
ncbi:hypothetical protein [Streptomyces lasiicapitis]|uniref:hypothetical protein n=1 Tax=Streptomyces lasiicapitis TaxID=1923961 RepID=UPI0036589915